MFRKGLKGTHQISHSDDLWGGKGNCAEGLMWRKFPLFTQKSSELMKILNNGIYLLLVKLNFFLRFTHISERITERELWSQRRESESLRQERALALPGGGHRPPPHYSSTDYIPIMGQGFPVKFIKIIVLENSRVVQWLKIYFAVQGTQVQSLAQKIKSHMPWCS